MDVSLDWAQITTIVALIVAVAAKAWRSRELEALRRLVKAKDEEVFVEQRRHNATKRQVKILRDELDEYRELEEEDQDELGTEEKAEDSGTTS